jgi:hypothetical protein
MARTPEVHMSDEFYAGLAVGILAGVLTLLLLSVFVWGHQW